MQSFSKYEKKFWKRIKLHEKIIGVIENFYLKREVILPLSKFKDYFKNIMMVLLEPHKMQNTLLYEAQKK